MFLTMMDDDAVGSHDNYISTDVDAKPVGVMTIALTSM